MKINREIKPDFSLVWEKIYVDFQNGKFVESVECVKDCNCGLCINSAKGLLYRHGTLRITDTKNQNGYFVCRRISWFFFFLFLDSPCMKIIYWSPSKLITHTSFWNICAYVCVWYMFKTCFDIKEKQEKPFFFIWKLQTCIKFPPNNKKIFFSPRTYIFWCTN